VAESELKTPHLKGSDWGFRVVYISLMQGSSYVNFLTQNLGSAGFGLVTVLMGSDAS